MADNIQIVAKNEACANIDSHNLTECTLRLVDCEATPTDMLLAPCDRIWNCNLCQVEQRFYLPWVDDMKFMIQTRFADFVNLDPENPTLGWGSIINADLMAANGTVISSPWATFSSRDLVAWDGNASYQILEVDTSLPAFDDLDCFYIRIRNLDSFGATQDELCTQMFKKDPCLSKFLLEGKYTLYDCAGHYYSNADAWHSSKPDNAPFRYSNAMYQWGYLMQGSDSFQKETFRIRTVQLDMTFAYNLILSRPIPPWDKNIIVRQQLAAPEVYVDGKLYELPSFSLENRWERENTMWLFDIVLQKNCKQNIRCSNQPFPEAVAPIPDPVTPEDPVPCVDCVEVGCIG